MRVADMKPSFSRSRLVSSSALLVRQRLAGLLDLRAQRHDLLLAPSRAARAAAPSGPTSASRRAANSARSLASCSRQRARRLRAAASTSGGKRDRRRQRLLGLQPRQRWRARPARGTSSRVHVGIDRDIAEHEQRLALRARAGRRAPAPRARCRPRHAAPGGGSRSTLTTAGATTADASGAKAIHSRHRQQPAPARRPCPSASAAAPRRDGSPAARPPRQPIVPARHADPAAGPAASGCRAARGHAPRGIVHHLPGAAPASASPAAPRPRCRSACTRPASSTSILSACWISVVRCVTTTTVTLPRRACSAVAERLFAGAVEVGIGLVEHQQLRLAVQRPRQGDALALAGREQAPPCGRSACRSPRAATGSARARRALARRLDHALGIHRDRGGRCSRPPCRRTAPRPAARSRCTARVRRAATARRRRRRAARCRRSAPTAPVSSRISVDLPAPLGPTTASDSPGVERSDTPPRIMRLAARRAPQQALRLERAARRRQAHALGLRRSACASSSRRRPQAARPSASTRQLPTSCSTGASARPSRMVRGDHDAGRRVAA